MTAEREPSDQLPEEQPPEMVPDDTGRPGEGETSSPGVPGEEATGTGNPGAAGAEDPDEDEDEGSD